CDLYLPEPRTQLRWVARHSHVPGTALPAFPPNRRRTSFSRPPLSGLIGTQRSGSELIDGVSSPTERESGNHGVPEREKTLTRDHFSRFLLSRPRHTFSLTALIIHGPTGTPVISSRLSASSEEIEEVFRFQREVRAGWHQKFDVICREHFGQSQ